MALMKYATFLQTVAFVGVPVQVTQEGDDGFTLCAVYKKGEEENVIEMAESVTAKGEEPQKKVFKGLATIERTLREAGIYEFSVKLSKEEITKTEREKTEKK